MTVENFHTPLSYNGQSSIGILLSHGFSGSPWSMKPLAQALIEQGYSVELPRLPGHGTKWQDMRDFSAEYWLEEIDKAYWQLKKRCDFIIVAGLPMGGTLAIYESIRRDVAGTILINPFINNPSVFLPYTWLVQYILPSIPGISSDIAMPDMDEKGYHRVPTYALTQLHQLGKQTRKVLPALSKPVLYFRSTQDHVITEKSPQCFLKKVHCPVKFIELENSYHVATLDYDAPTIVNESLDFIKIVEESV